MMMALSIASGFPSPHHPNQTLKPLKPLNLMVRLPLGISSQVSVPMTHLSDNPFVPEVQYFTLKARGHYFEAIMCCFLQENADFDKGLVLISDKLKWAG